MKKLLIISSFLFLLVIITACRNVATTTNQTTTKTTVQNNYADGTYTGTGTPREYGYEEAIVTITGGRITEIILKRMTNAGVEVNYDEWTGQTVNGAIKPNLRQFRLDMAAAMLAAQSPDVDVIASATDSSIGWMDAVSIALDKANKSYQGE